MPELVAIGDGIGDIPIEPIGDGCCCVGESAGPAVAARAVAATARPRVVTKIACLMT